MRKLYAIDTGLLNFIAQKHSDNTGQILEHAVFLELLRRDKEIYYHLSICLVLNSYL